MYYVVKIHSHTDKQLLWKVLSRPMKHKSDTEVWLDFVKLEDEKRNIKHREYMVVYIESV